MNMMGKFEELAAQYLRLALRRTHDEGAIPESEARRQLFSALELFLPLMLRQADAKYWRLEAFDAFRFPVARKIGPLEAEFRGAGLLLAAEKWIPLRVRLRAAEDADAIAWGSCQAGDQRSATTDPASLLAAVSERPERMDWAFSAEYPEAAP